ncbi:hypothetical protein Sent08_01610 [Salmonella enterica]|nr:hypothetical protein SE2072C2_22110 [Salmonella enterica]CAI3064945.1 hypothetical protein [Salmonella enterica subsp. enterica serovar Bredeney]SQI86564.1 Uncharacterised protein [Salmonella enterica subsp. enterica serovar Bredeney]SUE92689.1 Uncharacterised protein [Salmonella enterica]
MPEKVTSYGLKVTSEYCSYNYGAHNVLDCEMAWNTLFPLKTHNQMAAPISDKLEA